MGDQHAAPVGGDVLGLVPDFDAAECEPEELAHCFVVVARDVGDARALARLAQDLLDDVVVGLVPEPAALELPAVDDVAHQVELLALGMAEEIEQVGRLATGGTQMHVGNKDGAEPERGPPFVLRVAGREIRVRRDDRSLR